MHQLVWCHKLVHDCEDRLRRCVKIWFHNGSANEYYFFNVNLWMVNNAMDYNMAIYKRLHGSTSNHERRIRKQKFLQTWNEVKVALRLCMHFLCFFCDLLHFSLKWIFKICSRIFWWSNSFDWNGLQLLCFELFNQNSSPK